MEEAQYRYYGSLEDLTLNSILVSPDNELIQAKSALDHGIDIIHDGDVPFIPVRTSNYRGKMYYGNEGSIEYTLNEFGKSEFSAKTAQNTHEDQIYFDTGVKAAIELYQQGNTQQAKSKFKEMLEYWEKEQNLQSIDQELLNTINHSIVTGCSLTTYSYPLAVSMWVRVSITVILKNPDFVGEIPLTKDILQIPSRITAFENNGTILGDGTWSLLLGTLVLEQKEELFPQILDYQINKDKLRELKDLFSYSITEYNEGNIVKSISMLERKAQRNEIALDPLFDILRTMFIFYGYLELSSKGGNSETSEFQDKLLEYQNLLDKTILRENKDTWIVLEYLPISHRLPFSLNQFAAGLSTFFLLVDEVKQMNDLVNSMNTELVNALTRISYNYNQLKQCSWFKDLIGNSTIQKDEEPLYMKYIQGIDKIDEVVAFHNQMQALSDAYWTRDYVKAAKIYEMTEKLPDLDWEFLAKAREKYVRDIYPGDLKQQGMVIDRSQYYNIVGYYKWGAERSYEDAILYLKQSENYAKHPYDVSAIKIALGTLSLVKYDSKGSIEYYNAARSFLEKHEFPNLNSTVYENLSRIFMISKDYHQAEIYLNTAIFWAMESNKLLLSKDIANFDVNSDPYWMRRSEPLILMAQGKVEQALQSLQEQLEYSTYIGNNAILNRQFFYKDSIILWIIIVCGYIKSQSNYQAKFSEKEIFWLLQKINVDDIKILNTPELVIGQVAKIMYSVFFGNQFPELSIKTTEMVLDTFSIGPIYTHLTIYALMLAKLKYNSEFSDLQETIDHVINDPLEKTSHSLHIILHLISYIISTNDTKAQQHITKIQKLVKQFNDPKREAYYTKIMDLSSKSKEKSELLSEISKIMINEMVEYRFEADNILVQMTIERED